MLVEVVEMMLHPIANTIYELLMGSDEIVDWHVIDPIFCWVESILLGNAQAASCASCFVGELILLCW